jgi:hypothetical protein
MSKEKVIRENRGLLLNYVIKEFASPGILVDPVIARKTPCKCYTYKGKPKLCFSEGIIGSMSKLQIKEFCNPMIKLGESKTLKAFEKATRKARKKIKKLPKGERLEPWFETVAKELKKENIKI